MSRFVYVILLPRSFKLFFLGFNSSMSSVVLDLEGITLEKLKSDLDLGMAFALGRMRSSRSSSSSSSRASRQEDIFSAFVSSAERTASASKDRKLFQYCFTLDPYVCQAIHVLVICSLQRFIMIIASKHRK